MDIRKGLKVRMSSFFFEFLATCVCIIASRSLFLISRTRLYVFPTEQPILHNGVTEPQIHRNLLEYSSRVRGGRARHTSHYYAETPLLVAQNSIFSFDADWHNILCTLDYLVRVRNSTSRIYLRLSVLRYHPIFCACQKSPNLSQFEISKDRSGTHHRHCNTVFIRYMSVRTPSTRSRRKLL